MYPYPVFQTRPKANLEYYFLVWRYFAGQARVKRGAEFEEELRIEEELQSGKFQGEDERQEALRSLIEYKMDRVENALGRLSNTAAAKNWLKDKDAMKRHLFDNLQKPSSERKSLGEILQDIEDEKNKKP